MNVINRKKWILELIWFLVTCVLALMVLLPIYAKVPDYPYYAYNVVYIFIFVFFTKSIFLLKHTPYSHSQWFKLVIIFTAIPLFILLMDGMAEFQADWDDGLFDRFLGHLKPTEILNMSNYIRFEFMFFGVSSLITGIILPIRLIISIWRVRNRGTV